MKRIVVCMVGLLLIFPSLLLAQSMPVNTHQYSTAYVLDDSTKTWAFTLGVSDADTSSSFDLSTYRALTAAFKFGAIGTDLDSNAMRIYFQVTLDDTTWAKIDSIIAATIASAKLVEYSGTDSTYIRAFLIPQAIYPPVCALKGRFIFVADAGIEKLGVKIKAKIFKQR